MAEVQRWKHVTLLPVPFDNLPDHVRALGSFAFKPWVIADALRQVGTAALRMASGGEGGNVLAAHDQHKHDQHQHHRGQKGLRQAVVWVDASIELRRPVQTDIKHILEQSKVCMRTCIEIQCIAHYSGPSCLSLPHQRVSYMAMITFMLIFLL